MNYLRVKNWDQFQHYKDRNPPWIKLHRALLDDYEFSALSDSTKGQLMLIWLFASQNEGRIPQDAKFLERKLGLTDKCALAEMVTSGFLIPEQPASTDASAPLAVSKQDASNPLALARSREESQRRKATETDSPSGFDRFWSEWPRKVARANAEKAWSKINPDDALLAKILAAVAAQRDSEGWRKEGGKFIPHPATWLNGRRWEDETAQVVADELPADYAGPTYTGRVWGPQEAVS